MGRQLYELVQFEKSVRKMEKEHVKSLRKSAKKARKKDDGRLPADDAREQLDQALELLAMHIDTGASRELGEQAARVDLEVDGDVLLEDVAPRLLVKLRKPVKRLGKAAAQLERLHPDPEVSALAARADRLRRAIDRAIDRGNAIEVDERTLSGAVVDYLRPGSPDADAG